MSEAWRQTIVAFFLELSERFEAGKHDAVTTARNPPPAPYGPVRRDSPGCPTYLDLVN